MSSIQLNAFEGEVGDFRSEQVHNRAGKNAVIAEVQEEFCNLNPAKVGAFMVVVMSDEVEIDKDGDEANRTIIRAGGNPQQKLRMLQGLLETFQKQFAVEYGH